ncbi:MAG: hypothetical protein FWG05_05440, partial [Kiritimatiellaeota bacterium]|nr:hypothetical protein [Kiritimatiellota bacterium]
MLKIPEFDFSAPRNSADDVIDDLIDRVNDAYPPERLARIRSRSECTWQSAHSATEYTDRISYAMPAYASNAEIPADASDLQRETIWQLSSMLASAEIDSEYYPGFPSG